MNSLSQVVKGPGRPRDEEVRKRILDSAAQLLEDLCFDDITVDAIAEASGAGKATIYRWWPNKAAVLIEAFRERIAREIPFPPTPATSGRTSASSSRTSPRSSIAAAAARYFAPSSPARRPTPRSPRRTARSGSRPRRAEARKTLRALHRGGIADAKLDPDLAVELVFSPLYYRLLTGWGENHARVSRSPDRHRAVRPTRAQVSY